MKMYAFCIFRYNIDCQWIDITDVKEGNYLMRVSATNCYLPKSVSLILPKIVLKIDSMLDF